VALQSSHERFKYQEHVATMPGIKGDNNLRMTSYYLPKYVKVRTDITNGDSEMCAEQGKRGRGDKRTCTCQSSADGSSRKRM